MSDLDGETALVTGTSRGIGFAIARSLARAGARVAGVGRSATTLEAAMRNLGEAASTLSAPLAVAADLTQPSEVRAGLRAVEETWGFPSIVVHAAGSGGFATVDRLTVDAWEACRAINLDAVVFLATTVLPRMVERGQGHFVIVRFGRPGPTLPGLQLCHIDDILSSFATAVRVARSLGEEAR